MTKSTLPAIAFMNTARLHKLQFSGSAEDNICISEAQYYEFGAPGIFGAKFLSFERAATMCWCTVNYAIKKRSVQWMTGLNMHHWVAIVPLLHSNRATIVMQKSHYCTLIGYYWSAKVAPTMTRSTCQEMPLTIAVPMKRMGMLKLVMARRLSRAYIGFQNHWGTTRLSAIVTAILVVTSICWRVK